MLKHSKLPLLAVLFGLVGGWLRHWELNTAFEPITGVAIPCAMSSMALMACTAVVVLVSFLATRGSFRHVLHSDRAFRSTDQKGTVMLMVLSAAAMLAAGGLLAVSVQADYKELALSAYLSRGPVQWSSLLPHGLLSAGLLVSGCGFFALGKNHYKSLNKSRYSMWAIIPAFTGAFMVISVYQSRSADPILLDYVYELFAVLSCMLGAYYVAGFSFENPQPNRTVFFGTLGIYFSIVTMADKHELYEILTFAGFAIYFFACVSALVRNGTAHRGKTDEELEQFLDEKRREIALERNIVSTQDETTPSEPITLEEETYEEG